ncbi:MAG: MerR family transcriptional regulator [Ginsengibacter sp.]
MNNFSISQLAQFSGIKAHTIRIWEQRYSTLKPNRTDGNTRYYDDEQLRRLLNIVSLSSINYKVSDLSRMSDNELFTLVSDTNNVEEENGQANYFISQLISAGMSYDEAGFEKMFSHCLLHFGLKDTYLKVLYPLLVRLGFMWSSDKIPPTHEHFISNLIRQKLFTAIDSIQASEATSDTWVLFLPENEFHEIGLLFANYLLRSNGKKTIYLGTNVPLESVITLLNNSAIENVLLFFVHHDFPEEIKNYLTQLSNEFKGINIFVSSHQIFTKQLGKINKVSFLHSVEELEKQLIHA